MAVTQLKAKLDQLRWTKTSRPIDGKSSTPKEGLRQKAFNTLRDFSQRTVKHRSHRPQTPLVFDHLADASPSATCVETPKTGQPTHQACPPLTLNQRISSWQSAKAADVQPPGDSLDASASQREVTGCQTTAEISPAFHPIPPYPLRPQAARSDLHALYQQGGLAAGIVDKTAFPSPHPPVSVSPVSKLHHEPHQLTAEKVHEESVDKKYSVRVAELEKALQDKEKENFENTKTLLLEGAKATNNLLQPLHTKIAELEQQLEQQKEQAERAAATKSHHISTLEHQAETNEFRFEVAQEEIKQLNDERRKIQDTLDIELAEIRQGLAIAEAEAIRASRLPDEPHSADGDVTDEEERQVEDEDDDDDFYQACGTIPTLIRPRSQDSDMHSNTNSERTVVKVALAVPADEHVASSSENETTISASPNLTISSSSLGRDSKTSPAGFSTPVTSRASPKSATNTPDTSGASSEPSVHDVSPNLDLDIWPLREFIDDSPLHHDDKADLQDAFTLIERKLEYLEGMSRDAYGKFASEQVQHEETRVKLRVLQYDYQDHPPPQYLPWNLAALTDQSVQKLRLENRNQVKELHRLNEQLKTLQAESQEEITRLKLLNAVQEDSLCQTQRSLNALAEANVELSHQAMERVTADQVKAYLVNNILPVHTELASLTEHNAAALRHQGWMKTRGDHLLNKAKRSCTDMQRQLEASRQSYNKVETESLERYAQIKDLEDDVAEYKQRYESTKRALEADNRAYEEVVAYHLDEVAKVRHHEQEMEIAGLCRQLAIAKEKVGRQADLITGLENALGSWQMDEYDDERHQRSIRERLALCERVLKEKGFNPYESMMVNPGR